MIQLKRLMTRRYLRPVTIVAVLFALLSAALVTAAPAPLWQLLSGQPVRYGLDPLSPTEMARAEQLARQYGPVAAQLTVAERTEVLRVERHQEPKSVRHQGDWPRRADFFSYNYNTDTLTHAVVNLESGAVEQLETVREVQLPPTPAEVTRATDLTLNDPRAGPEISHLYEHLTGRLLKDPTGELKVHALIFRAEAMPDQVDQRTAACGRQRCVQLILSTRQNVLLNIVPVVNLSQQTVAGLHQFITE